MILYTDGCSMTEGTELFTEHYPEFIPHRSLVITDCAELERLGFSHLSHYNKTHCFPYLIAGELNWKLMNAAKSGSGNEVIAKRSLLNLMSLLEEYPANEIVALINWSDILRRVILTPQRLRTLVLPATLIKQDNDFNQHYLKHLTTHIEHEFLIGILILHNSINSIRSFCKRTGIKLLMTHSLPCHIGQNDGNAKNRILKLLDTQYWKNFFEQYVDTDNFFYFDCGSVVNSFEELIEHQSLGSFLHFSKINEFPHGPYYHPGGKAHEAWSQVLIEEMRRKEII